MYQGNKFFNCDLPCTVARSVKILTSTTSSHDSARGNENSGLSYIVCTFGDGRTLTMSFDHEHARQMAAEQAQLDQRLEHVARNESRTNHRSGRTALGDYQILSIGTIEPTLRSLVQPSGNGLEGVGSHSVLVCCDRPALFYLVGDRLEMQYLREDLVN